jgi:hypothetical protein
MDFKEVVVVYSKLHLGIGLTGVKVTTGDPCGENWCLGRDTSLIYLESKPTPYTSVLCHPFRAMQPWIL